MSLKIPISMFSNSSLNSSIDDDPNFKTTLRNNEVRTILLKVINQELSALKKTCKTKINDKFIHESEKEFGAQNTHFVKMQQKFSPNRENRNKGEVYQKKIGNKFITSSSDSPKSKYSYSQRKGYDNSFVNSSICLLEESLISSMVTKLRRKSISEKKMEFFKSSTLNNLKKLENSDSINQIFSNIPNKKYEFLETVEENLEFPHENEKTKIKQNKQKKTENGFKYLRNLSRKLKKQKKKDKTNFEGMKEIPYVKDNIIDKDNEIDTKFKASSIPAMTILKNDDPFFEDLDKKFMEELASLNTNTKKLKLESHKNLGLNRYNKNMYQKYLTETNNLKLKNLSLADITFENQLSLNNLYKNHTKTYFSLSKNHLRVDKKLHLSLNNSESNDFSIKLVDCSDETSFLN